MQESCIYCLEARPIPISKTEKDVDAAIYGGRPAISFIVPFNGGEFGEVKETFKMYINYCPICGRKLNV